MSESKSEGKSWIISTFIQLSDLIGFLIVCMASLALYIHLEKKFILHKSYSMDYIFLGEMVLYILLCFTIIGIIYILFKRSFLLSVIILGCYIFLFKDYNFSAEAKKYYTQYTNHINSFKLYEYDRTKLNHYYLEKSSGEILDIINKNNHKRKVRNYALDIIKNNYDTPLNYNNSSLLYDCFSIYRFVNQKWKYVKDPTGKEYFAPPTETMDYFSGDCDDYTIFMASILSSIGAKIRLITTDGHIYPELFIGNQNVFKTQAIPLLNDMFYNFFSYKEDFFFHIDKQGNYWLNMDFGNSPGKPFLDERIFSVINL